jgi:hypothetical protein
MNAVPGSQACPQCGAPQAAPAHFCANCGYQFAAVAPMPPPGWGASGFGNAPLSPGGGSFTQYPGGYSDNAAAVPGAEWVTLGPNGVTITQNGSQTTIPFSAGSVTVMQGGTQTTLPMNGGYTPGYAAGYSPMVPTAGGYAQMVVNAQRRQWRSRLFVMLFMLLFGGGLAFFVLSQTMGSLNRALAIPTISVPTFVDDPATVSAAHLAPITAYIVAGAANNADVASTLFIHETGWDSASRAEIARQFTEHPDYFAGYESIKETGFARVKVFGGSSYWKDYATVTYTDGTTRKVEAGMVQKGSNAWQLIEVKFLDK